MIADSWAVQHIAVCHLFREAAANVNYECSECVYPSANRFPTTFENEIRISIFVFCFPAISKNGIQISIFVFRFL